MCPLHFLIVKINIVHFSVSEGAGIDAHGPVIGVQDKSALGKGKIHLTHHKGIINGGHDELNFSVYPEEKEKVEQIVVEEMQNACQLNVPLVADAGWGNNWLEAH